MLTSLTLGLLASASPCVLPLYPGFIAYLSGSAGITTGNNKRYLLGFFVLAGVLTMMLLLGALIAWLSLAVGQVLSLLIPIADLIILSLGLMLLANFNPFKTLPQIQVPLISHPFANAFLYGLLYGPIALPCSGPLVVSIFALSFTLEEAAAKLSVFLWFGLGFGLPLLLLSLLSGAASHQITRLLSRHTLIINRVGGLLLIAIAIYDFAVNWELILAYWAG